MNTARDNVCLAKVTVNYENEGGGILSKITNKVQI